MIGEIIAVSTLGFIVMLAFTVFVDMLENNEDPYYHLLGN